MSAALSENSTTPKMGDDSLSNGINPAQKSGSSESSEELLHHPFPSFDHSSLVVQPYRQEAVMDVEYQERKMPMCPLSLLIVILNKNIVIPSLIASRMPPGLFFYLSRIVLQQKLLKLMLHLHAWSSSRPSHETTTEGEKLYQKTQEILDMEGEQGMSSLSFFGMHLPPSRVFEIYFSMVTSPRALIRPDIRRTHLSGDPSP